MGREVRMVPPDWEHPKNVHGYYKPLRGGLYQDYHNEREADIAMYMKERGYTRPQAEEYVGMPGYQEDEFMPVFAEGTATHYRMYENTSEGTPISPACATKEELARWLADNKASAFGSNTATYEQWLGTIEQGYAVSMVQQLVPDGTVETVSGVEAGVG